MLLLVGHGVQERPGGLGLEAAVRLELGQDVIADVQHPGGLLTLLRLLDGVDFVEDLADVLRGDEHAVQLDGQLLEGGGLLELDANRLEGGLDVEPTIPGVVDGEPGAGLTGIPQGVLADHPDGVAQEAEAPAGEGVHEEDVGVLRAGVVLELVAIAIVEVDEGGGTIEHAGDRFDLQLRHLGHDVLEEEVQHLRRLGRDFELLTNAAQANLDAFVVGVVLADQAVLPRHLLPAVANLAAHRDLFDLEVQDAAGLFRRDGLVRLPILVEARVLEDRDAVVAIRIHWVLL